MTSLVPMPPALLSESQLLSGLVDLLPGSDTTQQAVPVDLPFISLLLAQVGGGVDGAVTVTPGTVTPGTTKPSSTKPSTAEPGTTEQGDADANVAEIDESVAPGLVQTCSRKAVDEEESLSITECLADTEQTESIPLEKRRRQQDDPQTTLIWLALGPYDQTRQYLPFALPNEYTAVESAASLPRLENPTSPDAQAPIAPAVTPQCPPADEIPVLPPERVGPTDRVEKAPLVLTGELRLQQWGSAQERTMADPDPTVPPKTSSPVAEIPAAPAEPRQHLRTAPVAPMRREAAGPLSDQSGESKFVSTFQKHEIEMVGREAFEQPHDSRQREAGSEESQMPTASKPSNPGRNTARVPQQAAGHVIPVVAHADTVSPPASRQEVLANVPLKDPLAHQAMHFEAVTRVSEHRPGGGALQAITVRIEDAQGGRGKVDLRFVERAGEVKVTVRTADRALAESLAGELPRLQTDLQSKGWNADLKAVTQAEGSPGLPEATGIERPRSENGGDTPSRQQQEQMHPSFERRDASSEGKDGRRPTDWEAELEDRTNAAALRRLLKLRGVS